MSLGLRFVIFLQTLNFQPRVFTAGAKTSEVAPMSIPQVAPAVREQKLQILRNMRNNPGYDLCTTLGDRPNHQDSYQANARCNAAMSGFNYLSPEQQVRCPYATRGLCRTIKFNGRQVTACSVALKKSLIDQLLTCFFSRQTYRHLIGDCLQNVGDF